MPEPEKVQKRSQKYKAFIIKEGICKKKLLRHKKRCGGSERKLIDRNEERFRQLSEKVDKNKMADAEIAAEHQGLQAGEERRGRYAAQAVDCCLETMVEQIFAREADQARSQFDAMCQMFLKTFEAWTPSAQMAGKKEEEQ